MRVMHTRLESMSTVAIRKIEIELLVQGLLSTTDFLTSWSVKMEKRSSRFEIEVQLNRDFSAWKRGDQAKVGCFGIWAKRRVNQNKDNRKQSELGTTFLRNQSYLAVDPNLQRCPDANHDAGRELKPSLGQKITWVIRCSDKTSRIYEKWGPKVIAYWSSNKWSALARPILWRESFHIV